jgi:hypothetical protein
MKFQLLPLGARFEYEGKVYVKVGPLTAAAEDGGGQRMIPRHAALKAVDGDAPPPPAPAAPVLDREALLAAVEAHHARCARLLEQAAAGLDEPAREALRKALAAARRDLLSALAG